jgi:hypothetical protein
MDFSINGNNHNEPQINNIEENLGLSVEELNELLD